MLRPVEIAAGVTAFAARTPTLPPATHTNSYALGTRQAILVEPATPYEDEQREWLEWARALPNRGIAVAALIPTHHHHDHVAGLDVLQRELDVPIWCHADTAKHLETPVDRLLNDGDVLTLDGPNPARWTVLHTPGHAWGHVCLHEQSSGTIVVGDMVASVGTILIEPGDGDMSLYLQQLDRLAELDATCALPAHGDPITAPTELFRFYIQHRLGREAKVMTAVEHFADSGGDLDDLVEIAYSDTPQAIWPLAKLSLAAHLDKLIEDGRVTKRDARYRVTSEARRCLIPTRSRVLSWAS